MAGKAKSDKMGRNKAKCTAYKTGAHREINKLKGLIRHAKRFGFVERLGGFSPRQISKDVEAAFERLNARLSNAQITRACADMGVKLL